MAVNSEIDYVAADSETDMPTPADEAREQMASMGLSAPNIGSKKTRTEEEIKADRKTLAENVPILGEAMIAKEIVDDVKDENYLSAGLNTLALGVGTIPVVGKVANKPIRALARAMRKDVKVKPTSVAGPYYDAPTYGDYHSRAAQVDQKKGLEKLKKLQGNNADFDLIQETVSESRIGNTRGQTAQADKVSFNPVEIKNVKGLMGEELYRSGDYSPPGRGSKLELLKKNIKEKGYKPEPITIVVREDGAPFIAEGNHRLAEALESGRPKIDANIQYLRNAEKVDGPLNPKRLKNLKSDIDLLVRTSYEIKNNKSKFNKGGTVPMNNMAKQMEMFDDGGLMDEGGTVDPVSGNDVPPGSNQEEVRDDIPAQLSEGEFVFPADVVRFIGLEKLMMIRQRAKAGLQRMNDMGQMGNSEEAVMPDDLPFSIDDLDMEDDELEMAQGGVVHMANGGPVGQIGPPSLTYTGPPGIFGTNPNPNPQGLPTTPTTGVAAAPMQAASSNIARSIPIAQAATPLQAGSGNPTMFTDYELPQAPVPIMPQRDDLPAFLGEVTPGISGVDYVNEVYENEAGETETFRRYTDDRLLDENGAVAVIPEGYKIKSEAEKDVSTGPVKVETATVQDDGGSSNDETGSGGATVGWGGVKDPNKRGGLLGGLKMSTVNNPIQQVGLSYYNVGSLNPASMLMFSGNLAAGGEVPEGVEVGMNVNGVISKINAADYNKAKKTGYMGDFSKGLLDTANKNAANINKIAGIYGFKVDVNRPKTLEGHYAEAAKTDRGITTLANRFDIDVATIDKGFLGGLSHNDAVNKAVEEANKRGESQFGTGNFDKVTKEDIANAQRAFTNDDVFGTDGQGLASDPSGKVSGGASQAAVDAAREGGGGGNEAPDDGYGGVDTSRGEESSPGAGDAGGE